MSHVSSLLLLFSLLTILAICASALRFANANGVSYDRIYHSDIPHTLVDVLSPELDFGESIFKSSNRCVDDSIVKANRTLHIGRANETLEAEMVHFPEIALSFHFGQRGIACHSHFYHLIMNAALPIYSTMVRPFVPEKAPPRLTIFLSPVGGEIDILPEIFPEFDFVFAPWVPQCCGSQCISSAKGDVLNQRHIPLFLLDTSYFTAGEYRHSNCVTSAEVAHHSDVVRGFRQHIREWVPGPPGPLKHVFISRREEIDFDARIGINETGCDKRCLVQDNERTLINSLRSKSPVGLLVERMSGMSFVSQVQVHRDASLVIGVHGAACVHCLWMPDTSTSIEIQSLHNNRTGKINFEWICHDILGLKHSIFVAEGLEEAMQVNISNFTTRFERLLTSA